MAIFTKNTSKLFNKDIPPKCEYCVFGTKAKEGNKILCEKKGIVDINYSCSKYSYSPLKRIPVKQLNIHGNDAEDEV